MHCLIELRLLEIELTKFLFGHSIWIVSKRLLIHFLLQLLIDAEADREVFIRVPQPNVSPQLPAGAIDGHTLRLVER